MSHPEHILLVAFAYAPGKGSEPGIGWNVAQALARTHRVTVVTRPGPELPADSPVAIVRLAPEPFSSPPGPDMPRPLLQLYYYAWTRALARELPSIADRVGADLIQHVTYMRYWMPSAGSTGGRPFVWGPVGGGEGMSAQFNRSVLPASRRSQHLRSVIRATWERDPALRRTAAVASVALATTQESATRMARLTPAPLFVCPGVAISQAELEQLSAIPEAVGSGINLLGIGRLLDWKGYDLILDAMTELPESVTLKLIGDGPEKRALERRAAALNLEHRVQFTGWLDRSQVLESMGQSHVLVHPSYHDSGGMVCLEAMAAGLPVITLEGNGPALLAGSAGLPVASPSRGCAVRGLRRAITSLAEDRPLRRHLGEEGRLRVASQFTWERRAEAFEPFYRQAMLAAGTP